MKQTIIRTAIAIAAAIALAACTDTAQEQARAGINLTVSEIIATRAVKTAFEPGDVISIKGFDGENYIDFTLAPGGEWVPASDIDPIGTGEVISVTAIAGDPDARPREDTLTANADNRTAGGIELGIGPGGMPVWNINLAFKHTRPAVDVVVRDTDGDGIDNIDRARMTIELADGTAETITSADPRGIMLEDGCVITAVEVTIRTITYTATIPPGKQVTLVAGRRYTLTFTASPVESAVNIAPADELTWTEGETVVAGYDFVIKSPADLRAWRGAMNNPDSLNARAIQLADIDWGGADWAPVGISGGAFTGEYNGNGYTISGLNIGGVGTGTNSFAGMFGYVNDAELINIHLVGAAVTDQSGNRAGLLAGYAYNSTISLCSAQGAISYTADNVNIGGLIGYAQNTHTTRCYANAAITGTETANVRYIGGLIGNSYNSYTVACGANANIAATGGDNTYYAGGLIGLSEYNSRIYFCYATGSVAVTGPGSNYRAGGLAGYNGSNCAIYNSYATANASGSTDLTGSLVGNNPGNGHISACHASGAPAGTAIGTGTGSVSTSTAPGVRPGTVNRLPPLTIIGIRTAISSAGGPNTVGTRAFTSFGVWTTEEFPQINYGYEGAATTRGGSDGCGDGNIAGLGASDGYGDANMAGLGVSDQSGNTLAVIASAAKQSRAANMAGLGVSYPSGTAPVVIASAAKQSRAANQPFSGLLRYARNDGEGAVELNTTAITTNQPGSGLLRYARNDGEGAAAINLSTFNYLTHIFNLKT